MTRINSDHYVLSSGREIYAHHGLIGVSHQSGEETYASGPPHPWGEPNCGRFEVGEGFDGHLYDLEVDDTAAPDSSEWTVAEKIELADFMVEQWLAFKAEALKPQRLITATP